MAIPDRRMKGFLVLAFICFGLTFADDDSELVPFMCPDDVPEYKMDTALFTIRNDQNQQAKLRLYTQSEECDTCNLIPEWEILPAQNCSILVDTRWPVRIEIRTVTNESVKSVDPSCSEGNLTKLFLEYGDYVVYMKSTEDNEQATCSKLIIMNDPSDSNIPIYVALGIGVFLALVWILMKYLYRRGILHRIIYFWSTEGMMVHRYSTQDLGTPTNINAGEDPNKEDKKEKKERLKSLDTFRGMSILVMIFVNYRAGYYWFFKHSIWNGLNLADFVFPWFVWIMGTSMVFSFSSQLKRSTPKTLMFWKILKRSAILFLLGLVVNTEGTPGGVEIEEIRIPGVLQRFAGTYLIVATIHMFFAKTTDEHQHCWWSPVRDILDYWPEWILHLVMVTVWLAITFALPVPGCPKGYLGPGGLHEGGKYENCTGGAAGYIDRVIFGNSHIYGNPTAKAIYKTSVPYDPEGLLGTLTSCFLCFLGLQAGKILLQQKDWVQRCKRFLIWGIILGVIAAILSKASKNDGFIPICKNLWSLSFVLALSSLAFILFMLCYLLIDVWKVWSGAPFCYPGMNSIFYYVCHESFSTCFPVTVAVPGSHGWALFMDLWGPAVWCFVTYRLHVMKLYIAV
ncbi:heparan-alpha-glucosaminide N-acetyltransferase-like isoform X3 [Haliotis rufescens]|uniref:heparan-alpha-glucosaminide N-acetyltransferase-like isoform X3 n=1 Tax=Haliotis rufescens TaxID=6454 RepID=UPI00201EA08F|nr:heparan-alpha-glucosaminide N-acetyltransferase-like isoform X3 [Haliotis rufescens]